MLWPWQLIRALQDGSPEWGEFFEAVDRDEQAQAMADRAHADDLEDPNTPSEPPVTYPVVDMEDKAAKTRYRHNNKIKRTRWRPVDLSKRRVAIGLHQMGVERKDSSNRWHYTTCHRLITPAGRRLRVHPLPTRLVCTNAFDRAPWHCIGIEIAGNFERNDGDGRWYKPDKFGRGRMGAAQIEACRQEVRSICREVRDLGGYVEAIVPHRIAGRDKRGKPNRYGCPGSRAWSQVGEWAGANLHLSVPGDGFSLGGVPIDERWHGP